MGQRPTILSADMAMTSAGPSDRPPRLIHYTPLRYPGGKGKLAGYIKRLLKANRLTDGEYVEPYAGGAAIGLELLFHEYVSRIHINDVSRPVYAFWRSVLDHTDEFCRRLTDTPKTLETWDRQKKVLMAQQDHDDLTLGFAAFFLNRTNRSGILNAGVIGGRAQTGAWKLDARFNAPELMRRVIAVGRLKDRINLTRQNALDFLREGISRWPDKTLIYLGPPYYIKGSDLYHNYYRHSDHLEIADFVKTSIIRQKWVISYDNVAPIREMYDGSHSIIYNIHYSARSPRQGSEIMFFSDGLQVPALGGAMKSVEEARLLA